MPGSLVLCPFTSTDEQVAPVSGFPSPLQGGLFQLRSRRTKGLGLEGRRSSGSSVPALPLCLASSRPTCRGPGPGHLGCGRLGLALHGCRGWRGFRRSKPTACVLQRRWLLVSFPSQVLCPSVTAV